MTLNYSKISKANFSADDEDVEQQRELLEAATALGKREDEGEESADAAVEQAEDPQEDVEIAEQEDDVSGKLVDTDDPMLAEQEQEE